jgi:hypothetical protein
MKRSAFPLSAVCLFCAGLALANAETEARPRTREEARRLHEQADALRAEAEERHAREKKACWDKFLVSACLDDAARALREQRGRAQVLDKESREIEREIRKQEFAEREARRLENSPPTSPQQ